MRQALKTKLGCDRCKIRRKKCDEVKPFCGNCTRLDLICTWSAGRQQDLDHHMCDLTQAANDTVAAVITRQPLSSLLSLTRCQVTGVNGYLPFQDEGQFWLSLRAAKLYADSISRTVAANFLDPSVLVNIALQSPVTRDALAAFTAYSMFNADPSNIPLKYEALRLYQRALSTVHVSVRDESFVHADIDLAVAITFLGLTESIGTGDVEAAHVHFLASARVCRHSQPSCSWSKEQHALYLIVVESRNFNLASDAVYYAESEKMRQLVDYAVSAESFCYIPGSESHRLWESFLSQIHYPIYKLMLQTTCFVRQDLGRLQREQTVDVWLTELGMIRNSLERHINLIPDMNPGKTVFGLIYQLHILALEILLAKIRDNGTKATSSAIRSIVTIAKCTLINNAAPLFDNPMLAWPLTILLMAAPEEDSIKAFASAIPQIDAEPRAAKQVRLMNVVYNVTQHLRTGSDGIELLRRKNGILG